MRNRAKVLHEFAVGHADATVGKRDRIGFVISDDRNGEWGLGRLRRLPGGLEKAKLLARIGRVGDELANENLFICVKRMNDNIEELLNLRLEMVFFNCAHELRIPKVQTIHKRRV